MKKNLFYVLVLVVLGLAIYFFIIKKENSTLNAMEKKFNVEDTAAIGKIEINDMTGRKIVLDRKADGWWLNNKYPARKDAMGLILSTIKNLSIKYPVPEAANNNVIKEMAAQNKKVEIYDRSGQEIRGFFIGGSTPTSDASYMKTAHGRTAFAVTVPGFVGTMDVRFSTDENEMRSRSIFALPIMAIKNVKVDYPGKPDSSFNITVTGVDSFVVTRLSDNKMLDPKSLNKDRVGAYLNLFRFINAEAYENDYGGKDTILIQKPFCIITVTNRNNVEKAVQCYYKPLTQSTLQQYNQKGEPLAHDNDRYFATVNDGKDFVLIQQFHFGRLFQKINFFLTPPKPKK